MCFRTGKNLVSGISRVEGSTLKETSFIKLLGNKLKTKFRIFMDCPHILTVVITFIAYN
jgi:hypothetical protein